MQILISVLGFILFIVLILVHEWGHYYLARRNKVEVEEFGLGFPPRAIGKKTKSGMILSLNWLPLGGFVKLKGENDSDERAGSFGAASLAAKTKIMLAGVTMNLLVGLLILTLLAVIGMPKLINKADYGQEQFNIASDTKNSRQEALLVYIEPNSPADKAGIKPFDSIVSVSNNDKKLSIKESTDLKTATRQFAGQRVNVEIKRDGELINKQLQLRSSAEVAASLKTDNPKGNLGVEPYNLTFTKSTWSAPIVAVGLTGQLVELTAKGLWKAVSGLGSIVAGTATGNKEARVNGQDEASSQVGGPVAIFKILSGSGSLGFNYMLAIIALISLTLAFMNVLPIPALDGGRLAMMLISRGIFKKPLNRGVEEKIVGTSMLVLIALIILITVVDVKRFF